MKDLEDWVAVHQVYKQTKSKRATAEILGISRNTVKRLLKQSDPPVYNRSDYTSKIDPFKEQIIVWRCEPYCYNGTRIFRELKKRGYEGSIGPVYYYLRRVDEDVGSGICSKATTRHETPPGDQAQFDWSEYQVPIAGQYMKVYCFSMILAASRKKAVCFSLREDADAIYEAVQELFDDLGGVTLELLIDNPKAFVIRNNPKSEEEIKYNPHALAMAMHLGVELNACPCYWPRKKGKIERPFNYIEEQFIKGNTFSSMEDLNSRGKSFVNDWCDEIHSTTKRIPNQHYVLEEKAVLLPLPEEHFYVSRVTARKISPDSYISIGGNKYSVPVKYVGKQVYYRLIYGFRIMLYDPQGRFIQAQEVIYGKHGIRTNLEHYEPIAKKVSTSVPQIRRDFTARFTNGLKYLEAAGRKFDQPTFHARRIMELQDLYDDETLDRFIGMALDEGKLDIKSFKTMLREYNAGKVKEPRTAHKDMPELSDSGMPHGDGLTRDCSYYEEYAKEVLNG
ncbi:MAG: IS21 family transposase [Oribacterium sp.]|nr:IS21 family transposase [Oribacterium sp.]